MWLCSEHKPVDSFPIFGWFGRQCSALCMIIPLTFMQLLSDFSLFQQVGGGVLGDVWRAEERGKAIAIYSLAPLLGPVIGPVCGGW